MNYAIRGENIEVTSALKDYVEKKIGRLDRYFDAPPVSDVNVTLRVIRDDHSVEVTIPLPGVILRGEETNTDMYAAIDLVVDKLERQIRKHKTKINRKFRQDGSIRTLFKDSDSPDVPELTESDSGDDSIEIVRKKKFDLKPMDEEEAVLQMDMLGHNFFVFSNALTNQVNVVYKRRDGRYGLIEPE